VRSGDRLRLRLSTFAGATVRGWIVDRSGTVDELFDSAETTLAQGEHSVPATSSLVVDRPCKDLWFILAEGAGGASIEARVRDQARTGNGEAAALGAKGAYVVPVRCEP
jgi:hypothetical protein